MSSRCVTSHPVTCQTRKTGRIQDKGLLGQRAVRSMTKSINASFHVSLEGLLMAPVRGSGKSLDSKSVINYCTTRRTLQITSARAVEDAVQRAWMVESLKWLVYLNQ